MSLASRLWVPIVLVLAVHAWGQTRPADEPDAPDPRDIANPKKLVQQGRQRAERDFATGEPAIERFGLVITRCWVDEQTGLYIRMRGCSVTLAAITESEVYNERVRELVARRGLPKAAKVTYERYRKSLDFKTHQPELKWQALSLPGHGAAHPLDPTGPFAAGPYHLYLIAERAIATDELDRALTIIRSWSQERRRHRPGGGEDMTGVYVVIAKGDEQVDAEYLLPSDSLAAAYWPQTEMMIFREDEGPGEFTFYDLVNRRDMWAWAPALERRIDQPGREPAEPTSTAPASLPAEGDE